ncbi:MULTISPECIES: hypothetical protein [unclassified Shinella]|uniref:hypothetical protein n=1 Tax=unclassified Shinella TaxID=2643062 RepID=UPI00234E51EC|nr:MULTISPECIES: hypothetical protein [unclassified Shinella]MCO5153991.1 hypothetical protein [Shinella sp.]MDC7266911.1 hypothetical protein [Shinella sp. HY16]MDC7273808.1 hypothetical protein [Shinella sp. YZ44]
MSAEPSFTLYTYSPELQPVQARWCDDGIGDAFFGNAETARAAVAELRDAVADEPGHDWPPMRLERIETVPVTRDAFLALLNNGVGAIIKTYDIIETIGGN